MNLNQYCLEGIMDENNGDIQCTKCVPNAHFNSDNKCDYNYQAIYCGIWWISHYVYKSTDHFLVKNHIN